MLNYKKLLLALVFSVLICLNFKIYFSPIKSTCKSWAQVSLKFMDNLSAICRKELLLQRNKHLERLLKRAIANEEIVVSFSTTPYRINKIKPVLQTLFNQNVKINKIYLSIPNKFKRDKLEYVIPQWLKDEQRVTILRTEDYGPATKLLGVLEQVRLSPKTIIITVDDDIHYPKNLILHLAYTAKKFPNNVIALSGADIDYDETANVRSPGHGVIDKFESNSLVDVVKGFSGVAYRAGFFDESIFQIKDAPNACYIHDDFYISFYLARHSIPRRILNNKLLSIADIHWNTNVGFKNDALFKITPLRADICRTCLAYLRSRHPNVDF